MKHIDLQDNRYIDNTYIGKESNNKDCRFKIGDCARISKY